MTMKTLKRSISLARRYVFLFCFMSLIGGLRVLQKAKQKRQTKRKVVSQVFNLFNVDVFWIDLRVLYCSRLPNVRSPRLCLR